VSDTEHPILEVRRRKVVNVLRGEPWVYPNAVPDGDLPPAGLVEVRTDEGQSLGLADFNPRAPIRARILCPVAEWQGEYDFLQTRISRALNRRIRQGFSFQGAATRLVNSEGDGAPGLIIDGFARTLVVDFLSKGMRDRCDMIHEIVEEIFGDCKIIYRMGEEAAKRESVEALDPEPHEVAFGESGILYKIDLGVGQKTGFYLDQRDNRALISRFAQGRKVLDLFSYQGAFGLAALAAGAQSALAVDSSEVALEKARAHSEANNLGLATMQGSVFDLMEPLVEEGPFDLIVIDPPKMAPTRRDYRKAMGGYRYLVDRALDLLSDAGILFVCSCSHAIDDKDLQGLVAQISVKKGLSMDVLAVTGQPPDHPWPVAFRTGRYLSALLLERRQEVGGKAEG